MKIARIAVLLAAILFAAQDGVRADPSGRIVSIAPSFTEILFALGLGNSIAGSTTYCDYPPEAKNTPKIGDLMNPDVEKVISLKPDLVFAGKWKWEVPDKLRKVGIRVVEVPDAETLKDCLDRIVFFGRETGRNQQAADIVASMQARIDALRMRGQKAQPKLRAFVELDAGQWTVGSKSYINDVIDTLGLENIFKDRSEPYLMVTMESIISRNPDVLISLSRLQSDYQGSPAWRAVKAVREGKIIDKHAIQWDAITHQGPRLVDGMEALEKQIRKTTP